MTNASVTARNLNKSAYFFSISSEDQKVSHSSTVPKDAITKEFNAKLWMAKVIEVLGGKVSNIFNCISSPTNRSFAISREEEKKIHRKELELIHLKF